MPAVRPIRRAAAPKRPCANLADSDDDDAEDAASDDEAWLNKALRRSTPTSKRAHDEDFTPKRCRRVQRKFVVSHLGKRKVKRRDPSRLLNLDVLTEVRTLSLLILDEDSPA